MIDSNDFMTNYDAHFIAPARINLIGEHIDYNGGSVLPACINLYVDLYVKKRKDNIIRIIKTQEYKKDFGMKMKKLRK